MTPTGGPFGALGGVPPRRSSGPIRDAEGAAGRGRLPAANGASTAGAAGAGRSGLAAEAAAAEQGRAGQCGQSEGGSRAGAGAGAGAGAEDAVAAREGCAACREANSGQGEGHAATVGAPRTDAGRWSAAGPAPCQAATLGPRSAPEGSLWGRAAGGRTSCRRGRGCVLGPPRAPRGVRGPRGAPERTSRGLRRAGGLGLRKAGGRGVRGWCGGATEERTSSRVEGLLEREVGERGPRRQERCRRRGDGRL